MLWFLLDPSSSSLDIDCCWCPIWLVPRLPPVACTCILVPLFPDLSCYGASPSAMVLDYFLVYFLCFPCFTIIFVRPQKLRLLIFLLPAPINLDYRCLLIILLSTVKMTLDSLCLLIFCCDDLFFFFWTGLRDHIACPLLSGGSPSQNSGYNITRLYPCLC